MNLRSDEIQKAVLDVAALRRALESNQSSQKNHPSGVTAASVDAHFFIQFTGVIIALAILAGDLATGFALSDSFRVAIEDRELQTIGVAQIGGMLLLLVSLLYFIVWRGARIQGESFETYLEKNFSYLNNLNLQSDLLMKFSAVAFLTFAGKPHWMTALFVLYVGDLLIQGRVFTLPLRASFGLGVACIAGAAVQCYFHSFLIVWPAIAYIVAGTGSAIVLHRKRRAYVGQQE